MRLAARLMSALDVTIQGAYPPSSRTVGVKYFAAAAWITLPIFGEPVKKIWSKRRSSIVKVS